MPKCDGKAMARKFAHIFVACFCTSMASAMEVSLTVAEPSGVSRKDWPLTSGIPFARGELKDAAAAALFSSAGKEIPLQTEALAYWPDGSVRWLLLDFLIDLPAHEKTTVLLRF